VGLFCGSLLIDVDLFCESVSVDERGSLLSTKNPIYVKRREEISTHVDIRLFCPSL